MSQAQRHAPPLNRSESQARTRAALLDAAEALIVEHSIPALSLRAVCTRAGYTQGAFYSNFADREELLLEVMERNLEQKAASLEQMLATCGDAGLDGTLACILDWLDTIHHRGEWARIAMELGYRKFNRPFWRVWRVGSGRAIDPEAGQKPADNPQNGDESSRFDCGSKAQVHAAFHH